MLLLGMLQRLMMLLELHPLLLRKLRLGLLMLLLGLPLLLLRAGSVEALLLRAALQLLVALQLRKLLGVLKRAAGHHRRHFARHLQLHFKLLLLLLREPLTMLRDMLLKQRFDLRTELRVARRFLKVGVPIDMRLIVVIAVQRLRLSQRHQRVLTVDLRLVTRVLADELRLGAHSRVDQELRHLPAVRRVARLDKERADILDRCLLLRLRLRERRTGLHVDGSVALQVRRPEIEDLPCAVIAGDLDGARVRVEPRDKVEEL